MRRPCAWTRRITLMVALRADDGIVLAARRRFSDGERRRDALGRGHRASARPRRRAGPCSSARRRHAATSSRSSASSTSYSSPSVAASSSTDRGDASSSQMRAAVSLSRCTSRRRGSSTMVSSSSFWNGSSESRRQSPGARAHRPAIRRIGHRDQRAEQAGQVRRCVRAPARSCRPRDRRDLAEDLALSMVLEALDLRQRIPLGQELRRVPRIAGTRADHPVAGERVWSGVAPGVQ